MLDNKLSFEYINIKKQKRIFGPGNDVDKPVRLDRVDI